VRRKAWALFRRSGEKFLQIEGTQRAGALAYSSFASLFPTILLFVSATSFIIDRDRAGRAAIGFVENFVPMSDEMRRLVFSVIYGMVAGRRRAGAVALLILVWIASQCFGTLIAATNRAWGISTAEWWRLPLRSLVLLMVMAGAASVSVTAPPLMRFAAARLLHGRGASIWIGGFIGTLLPMVMEFIGLSLFYRFAPRRRTRFAEVRTAALVATLLLRAAESLFVIYLEHFAASNAVYGVFGGIMALLLWIYLSGCIFIYGACLCAARSELFAAPP
jgi:Ca2+-transporting ATPase